jgi:AraC family ethanolamine operon transcriptional activator
MYHIAKHEKDIDWTPAEGDVTNYKFSRTRSLDEHAEALSNWHQQYDQISPGQFDGYFAEAWFDEVQVLREWTRPSVLQQGRAANESLTIVVPISMSKPGLFCGQQFTSDSIMVFSSEYVFSFVAPADCDIVATAIPQSYLAQFAENDYGISEMLLRGSNPIVLNPSDFCLYEIKSLLIQLLNGRSKYPDAKIIENDHAVIKDVILGKVGSALASSAPSKLPSPSFKGRSYIVRQVAEYAISRIPDVPAITEICQKAKINQRLLNYAFHDVLGIRPLSYFRYLRLNGFRRELIARYSDPILIGDIAARWGFWHLSRLATEYKELFGELPSETLKCYRKKSKGEANAGRIQEESNETLNETQTLRTISPS